MTSASTPASVSSSTSSSTSASTLSSPIAIAVAVTQSDSNPPGTPARPTTNATAVAVQRSTIALEVSPDAKSNAKRNRVSEDGNGNGNDSRNLVEDCLHIVTNDFMAKGEAAAAKAVQRLIDIIKPSSDRSKLKTLCERGLLTALTMLLKCHMQDSSVVQKTLKLVQILTFRGMESLHTLAQVCMLHCVLDAMKHFVYHRNIMFHAVGILRDLFRKECRLQDCGIFLANQGPALLRSAMEKFSSDEPLQQICIWALDLLSQKSEEFRTKLFDAGVLELVARAMRTHRASRNLQSHGKRAFINLTDTSEEEYNCARKRQKTTA